METSFLVKKKRIENEIVEIRLLNGEFSNQSNFELKGVLKVTYSSDV